MSDQRPSKKQREVLNYIDGFITENGFGPSYREVMRALNYKSVSTVAIHVNELIARGLLQKRENSARSLQVVSPDSPAANIKSEESHLEWLRQEVAKREADETLTKEAVILKDALALLDQPEEK